MPTTAADLREKLARVGRAKAAAREEDVREHLRLDLAARLLSTIAHCDAHIDAFGDGAADLAAADADTAARVRRRLPAR